MKVTYDREAKALYIYILEGDFKRRTEELVEGLVFLDKDPLEFIAGIEILGVDKIEEAENV